MSHRSRELAERSKRLQLTCAAQRAELAELIREIEEPSLKIDRLILKVQGLLKNPGIIFGAAALIFIAGPKRLLRLGGRAWLFISTARRLMNR
jgi:hypothetical protein